MSVKIIKQTIETKSFSFNVMIFLPSPDVETRSEWALMTHGYTAHKGDCLNWAQRLSDVGIPSIIFDQPGHHLGSFNEVPSFEHYQEHAHTLFEDAFKCLLEHVDSDCEKVILAGHSLGALLSMKALELEFFASFEKIAIGVGFGISQHKSLHLFESSFYEKTLNIRKQLVHENIGPDHVFPWINEEKTGLSVSGHRIHLICGIDDVVVGTGGVDSLMEVLESNDNEVTIHEPKKLPHHEPMLAGSHIYSFLKKELSL